MKYFLFSLLTFLFSCTPNSPLDDQIELSVGLDVTDKAKEAYHFVVEKKMNTDFCFLLDFSKHSGLKRFYVYDFKQDMILDKFLVSHGAGKNSWSGTETKENPMFSNEDGSHLSSLGKYSIGERGWSNWGINVKYIMHGLESSNSNALQRVIVLHGWENVNDEEIYPQGTPEGWGCPAVSNSTMHKLDDYLKSVNKPTLLWIYNE